MAQTASAMLALGTVAPDFALTDVVTGKTVRRDDFRGKKALLVMFICAHCPFVKHIEKELAELGKDYADQPLGIVAISSNDAATHPADSPAGLKQQAETFGFVFPYLYDETQSVAHAYDAACTPDFFLFDADFTLSIAASSTPAAPATESPSPAKTSAPPSIWCSPASPCQDQRPRSAAISSGKHKASQSRLNRKFGCPILTRLHRARVGWQKANVAGCPRSGIPTERFSSVGWRSRF